MRRVGNDIETDEGEKLGTVTEDGLRMARGHAKHRAEVEAFLAGESVGDDPEDDDAPAEPEPVKASAPKRGDGPPEPEDVRDGDMCPKVIAWWFKHEPEKALDKYQGRRGDNLKPYLDKA